MKWWITAIGGATVFAILAVWLTSLSAGKWTGITPLHLAVVNNDTGRVRTICQRDPVTMQSRAKSHVDQRINGASPLILACILDRPLVLEELVMCGANVNDRDAFGRTALMWAIDSDCHECLVILATSGADLEIETPTGETPLRAAAESGRLAAVELLLLHGANPKQVDLSRIPSSLSGARIRDAIADAVLKLAK